MSGKLGELLTMKRAFCMGVSVCAHRHLAYRLLHFNFPWFCSPQHHVLVG